MRRLSALRLVVCVVAAWPVLSAHALSERWVSASPATGRVADYVVPDPSTLIVSSYGGHVYKSIDGGARFFRSSNGLPAQGINSIARNLAASPTIWVATDGSGVFKSTDLGANWTDSNGSGGTMLACWFVDDIQVSQSDVNRLYAVSGCNNPTGVFRSSDGGATWSAALTGGGAGQMPVGTVINSVAIDPTNADVVYASGADTGVWKSTDAGNTWTQINTGLSGGAFATLTPLRVQIDPTATSKLYVAVRGGGVFASTNGGASWTLQASGLPAGDLISVSLDRSDSSILYATFGNFAYKGVNTAGTVSWSLFEDTLPGVTLIGEPLVAPTTLYALSFAGLFRSTDGGAHWDALGNGLAPSTINAVQTDPANPDIVYATTFEALYRSSDRGVTWTRKAVSDVVPRSGFEQQIAVDPVTPTTVYVATLSYGIFKSTNSGDSFAAINTGLPANLLGSNASVALAPSSPSTLYAGLFDTNAGFFKSTNGGASWSDLSGALSSLNANAVHIRAIYVNPANANDVWVLTGNGPYHTTNGGTSFTLPGPAFANARGMAFDPADATKIWLGRNSNDALGNPSPINSGVYFSANNGATYAQKLGSVNIQRIAAIRSGAALTVGASAFPDDVYDVERSDDGGTTWFNDNVGLVSDVIRSIDTDVARTKVRHIGGDGIGVARKSILPYGPDYDRTGRADVFWRNSLDGSNVQWFMDGPNLAGFAFQVTVPLGGYQIVAQADFDGDGKTDILWRDPTTGSNLIWFMDGPTLKSSAPTVSVAPGAGWTVAGTGDFNCDGKADIFWRNTASGLNTIWLMNGATQLSSTFQPTVPTSWSVVGVADIDGDCKADVFWRESIAGLNASWLMNGAAIVGGANFYVTVPPAQGWTPIALGDFNGDGRADLYWRNSDGSNLVWFLDGATLLSSGFLPPLTPAAEWLPASVADFDGDGLSDIFWRHTTDGLNAIWFLHGASLVSVAFQPSVPPATGWVIQKQ